MLSSTRNFAKEEELSLNLKIDLRNFESLVAFSKIARKHCLLSNVTFSDTKMSGSKTVPKDDDESKYDDKITECLICGKLFPRGPIDLARHGAAVTLKHIFTEKKSNSFPLGCKKCNTYFSTKEHLEMHTLKSRCNPAVVLKRIEEAKQLELDQSAAALKKALKSETEENNTLKSTDGDEKEEDISTEQPVKKDPRASREAATVASNKIAKQSHPSSIDKTKAENVPKEPKEVISKMRSKSSAAALAAAAASGAPRKFTCHLLFCFLFCFCDFSAVCCTA